MAYGQKASSCDPLILSLMVPVNLNRKVITGCIQAKALKNKRVNWANWFNKFQNNSDFANITFT